MKIRYGVLVLFLLALGSAHAQNFWQSSSIPGVTKAITALAVSTNGVVFAGTNGNGLYRSTDGGATWTRCDVSPMKAYYYTVATKGDTVFAGSYLGSCYRSLNGGVTWTEFPIGTIRSIVTSFTFLASGTIIAGTGTDGLHATVDGGTSWTKLSALPSTGAQTTPNIFSLASDNTGYLYAGTYGSGVYRAESNGILWNADGMNGFRVNAFARNPLGGMFAATEAGIWKDTIKVVPNPQDTTLLDTTRVWKNVLDAVVTTGDTLLFQFFATSLVSTPSGHIVAGTAGRGAFRSTNAGERWDPVNTGLVGTDIRTMAMDAQGFIYCGTINGTVFKSSAAESMTPIAPPIAPPSVIPKAYAVEPNYPNPFNPSTTIPFALPLAGRVSLKVYNAIGQEIASLLDQEMPAGTHAAVWDASNIPSGMYFYRFQSASFSQTGKLMLMK